MKYNKNHQDLYRISRDFVTREQWIERKNAWAEAPFLYKDVVYDPDPWFEELTEDAAKNAHPSAFKDGIGATIPTRYRPVQNPLTVEDMSDILVLAIQNLPVSRFVTRSPTCQVGAVPR